MESTRPIRALTRGLDALTVLNFRDGATVSEVAQEIRLPRTTVYRILETLSNAGFVFRDATDDRYRLTQRVRDLSEGFADEDWVRQIAGPPLHELGRDIVWPVSLATPAAGGGALMLRETTDHQTSLVAERTSAGLRVPLLTTAPGRVYLAFSAEPPRDLAIDATLAHSLAEIKAQGFAVMSRTRRMAEEVTLSVPVVLPDRVLAVLSARFAAPAAGNSERYLPKLRQCAARITSLYLEQQAA